MSWRSTYHKPARPPARPARPPRAHTRLAPPPSADCQKLARTVPCCRLNARICLLLTKGRDTPVRMYYREIHRGNFPNFGSSSAEAEEEKEEEE